MQADECFAVLAASRHICNAYFNSLYLCKSAMRAHLIARKMMTAKEHDIGTGDIGTQFSN
jgi:hypothetical protein